MENNEQYEKKLEKNSEHYAEHCADWISSLETVTMEHATNWLDFLQSLPAHVDFHSEIDNYFHLYRNGVLRYCAGQ